MIGTSHSAFVTIVIQIEIRLQEYLIFRIHYPLPLDYCGAPDPQLLQANIRRLEGEINRLQEQLEYNTNSGGNLRLQERYCNTHTLPSLSAEVAIDVERHIFFAGLNRLLNRILI